MIKAEKLFARLLCCCLCCCLCITLACVLAACGDGKASAPKKDLPLTVSRVSPQNGSEVTLANSVVAQVCADYKAGKTKDFTNGEDLYYNRDIVLEWDSDEKAEEYFVRLSVSPDFKQAAQYVTNEERLELSDLLVATEYFWDIRIKSGENVKRSRVYGFVTAATPRTLRIGGVSNTRDIGGYKADGGKRVAQGMAYRGAKPDGITQSGLQKLKKTYGIKTQLDLRGATARAVFGEDVRFVPLAGLHYADNDTGIHLAANRELLAQEIRVFAHKENYPVFFPLQCGARPHGNACHAVAGFARRFGKRYMLGIRDVYAVGGGHERRYFV